MRDRVQEASFDSFPASDPPTWIGMHAGAPRHVTIQGGRTVLSIIADGERRYRIIDGTGSEIGWIRGRAARFVGFQAASEVIDAARRAWLALEPLRSREGYRPARRRQLGDLRFVHDGAYEWVSDGIIPVARIIRPRGGALDGGSYAIEWVLPAQTRTGVSLATVHAIAMALGATAAPQEDSAPMTVTGSTIVEGNNAAKAAGEVRHETPA